MQYLGIGYNVSEMMTPTVARTYWNVPLHLESRHMFRWDAPIYRLPYRVTQQSTLSVTVYGILG